jgi:hypothetical protein
VDTDDAETGVLQVVGTAKAREVVEVMHQWKTSKTSTSKHVTLPLVHYHHCYHNWWRTLKMLMMKVLILKMMMKVALFFEYSFLRI